MKCSTNCFALAVRALMKISYRSNYLLDQSLFFWKKTLKEEAQVLKTINKNMLKVKKVMVAKKMMKVKWKWEMILTIMNMMCMITISD